MSQLRPIRTETASPVSVPDLPFAQADGFSRIFWMFTKSGRALRAEMADKAELGRDLLDGRADVAKLKGEKAEPYFQGLDVLEARSERLLEIVAIRARQGQRNPWRQSPQERLAKKQPKTAAGARQAAWLAKLEQAGLVRRPHQSVA